MAEVIRMPRLSDTMEEGVIVGWLKKVGDPVAPGDVLAEVETDKATMELESFQDGYLLYIGIEEGPVPVNGIIAVIGDKDEDFKALLAEAEKSTIIVQEQSKLESTPSESSHTTSPSPAKTISQPAEPSHSVHVATPGANGDSRVKASPLAKSMAKEAGISIDNVPGTGDGGRIIKRDVENYLKDSPTEQPGIKVPAQVSQSISFGDHPVSQMRKTIARRLSESKFGAPHFYLTIEVNMENTWNARKAINETAPVKISFNDFVVKACAMALRIHPKVNSSWLGDTIRVNKDINIGVAVAVDEGLLVPVIRNADYKSFVNINTEVKELAERARNRKLGLDEMQGNTFTVSNLGMFGIEEFTAIINPPDACILAVGAIIEKPIVKDGQIAPGKMMKVTLSCDHRVVDGATGAQFLKTLKGMLEHPVSMLV